MSVTLVDKGPYAPILLQEVINTVASGGNIDHIQTSMNIHPSREDDGA
jgi:hypothetical protein